MRVLPPPGLLCDLLWSDPDKDVQGWGENERGVSVTFGPDIVTEFNICHGLDLICRSHRAQVSEMGQLEMKIKLVLTRYLLVQQNI